jgi:phosphogluconate dehydratase
MSGASGKVPAAIHVCPEAADGGPLARLRDGDLVRVDAVTGTLEVLAPDFADRTPVVPDLSANTHGTGRELFALFRQNAGLSSSGASSVI